LKVLVKDTSENEVSGATVDCTLGATTESETTDSLGIAYLLLLGNKITPSAKEGTQSWDVTASISGASGSTNNVNLPKLLNEADVTIELVKVSITEPIEGSIVYGLVSISGTATGPNPISSVLIQIGSGVGQEATSVATDSNPFSTWTYSWDSTTIASGQDRLITAIASDGQFSDTDLVTVKVGDAPVAPELEIKTPSDGDAIVDYEGSSGTSISGTTKDLNKGSKTLTHSQNITQVIVSIKDKSGIEVFKSTIPFANMKYNDTTEEYTWSTVWPTRQPTDTGDFEYSNGNYTIEVTVHDNTIPSPLSRFRKLDVSLHHIVKPTAKITSITASKNGKYDDEYNPGGIETAKVFKFKSEKGKTEVTIRFDLTGSDDPDSDELYFYLDAGDSTEFKWVEESVIENTYIISESEEKVTKNYRIQIRVRDGDNEQNDQLIYENKDLDNITVIIEFIPADPGLKGPLSGFLPLPLATIESRVLFIIMIILFNVIAALMIQSKFNKIKKRRLAREAAVNVAQHKMKGEEASTSSALQFEDAAPEGDKEVAVAGAAGAMALPTDEEIAAGTEQQLSAAIEQQDAPQLISIDQEEFQSVSQTDTTTEPQIQTPEPIPAQPQPVTQPQVPAAPVAATPATTTTAPPTTAAPAPATAAVPQAQAPTAATTAPSAPAAPPATTTEAVKQQNTTDQTENQQ
jgi:hypothetical protein